MTDINLKTLTPDTSLPTTGFLFGADSQASTNPSVYGVTTAITAILGNAASSDALIFNSDTYLIRKAARNFQLGQADASTALAQTLSVQSVVAGTSNTAGQNFTITGSQGTGTGAGGSIVFQVAPAGGSGTAQNALVPALTIGGDRSLSFNGTLIAASGVPQTVIDISVQPYPKLKTSNFSYYASNSSGAYYYVSPGYIEWRTSDTGGFIIAFNLEAAGTYAQRNGTAAQAFRVYNTYTDASNYERAAFDWTTTANTLTIGPQAAGSGTLRNIAFTSNILWSADNIYDIGTSSANRPRSVYVGTSITPGAGVLVANLPTPTTGMVARVTNALAPAIGTVVAGGGAAQALVWYNGANWTVIGV